MQASNYKMFGVCGSLRLCGLVLTMVMGGGLLGCVESSTTRSSSSAASADETPAPSPTGVGSSFPSQNLTQGRRVALIIGNAAYTRVPKLANPVNDAKDLSEALRRLGFDVEEQKDVGDNRKMRDVVRRFGEKLRGGGVGLFYYSGHGIQVNGENYLIPTGAELRSEADVEYETMRMKYVQSTLDDAKNGMNIIILDACRDNPFARSIRSSKRGGGEMRGLAQMDSVAGSIVAFSTAPGDTAEDGSGRNGTYTKHLLAHISTSGLSVESVFKRVRVGVSQDTHGHQTPWESSSLTGEFCFAGCTDSATVRHEAELQQELTRQRAAAVDAERLRAKAEQELRQSGQTQLQSVETEKKQTYTELERLRAELDKAHRQAEEKQATVSEAERLRLKAEQEYRQAGQTQIQNVETEKKQAAAELERLHTELEKVRRQAEESQSNAEKARLERDRAEQASLQHKQGMERQSQRSRDAEMEQLRADAEKARRQAAESQAVAEQARLDRERAERAIVNTSVVATPRQHPQGSTPPIVGF